MAQSKEEIKKIISRYLDGKLDRKDFDAFLDGIDAPELSDTYDEVLKERFEEILSDTNDESTESKAISHSTFINRYWKGIAASLLLIGAASLFFLNSSTFQPAETQLKVFSTANAKQESHTLEDGSTISLNVGSTITQFPFEGSSKREVSLEGEAFFSIEKDKTQPFEITAQNLKIIVVGTAFNVSAYPEDELMEVYVTEGIVEINMVFDEDNRVSTTLEVGDKLIIDKTKKSSHVEETNTPIYWRSKVLHFDQTEFTQVISDLERWYDVELEVLDQSLYDLKLNGDFKNQSVNEVISAISFIANKSSEDEKLIRIIPSTENQ